MPHREWSLIPCMPCSCMPYSQRSVCSCIATSDLHALVTGIDHRSDHRG